MNMLTQSRLRKENALKTIKNISLNLFSPIYPYFIDK